MKLLLLAICFLSAFEIVSPQACKGNLSTEEFNVLYLLYNSTHGEDWVWNVTVTNYSEWNFPSSVDAPCNENWQGVTCGNASSLPSGIHLMNGECFIDELQLHHHNLRGEFPVAVAELTYPSKLVLSSNFLYGSLPDSLFALTSLQWLGIGSNLITGTISTLIGNMVNLSQLEIFDNFHSGTIPSTIGRLTRLVDFEAFRNHFEGPIPTELGSLVSLQTLGFNINKFTGQIPSELGNMCALKYLYLDDNKYTGTFPTALTNPRNLSYIWLYANVLTGPIPLSLWTQDNQLSNVAWQFNYFSGSLAPEIASASGLTYLGFSYNIITGKIPSTLGQLPVLKFLYLSGNQISGTIPRELGTQHLSYLTLYYNYLTGTIPSELVTNSAIIALNLYGNYLSGTIPACIYGDSNNISSLQYLFAYENKLTGSLPTELSTASNLEVLLFGENTLTGEISGVLTTLPNLVYVDLGNNKLSGRIPYELTLGIEFLILYENLLTGTMPSSLSNLIRLNQLLLHENFLTGTLPNHLAESLSELILSHNSLTGTIPQSYQSIRQLRLLNVSTNMLSGHLANFFAPLSSPIVVNLFNISAYNFTTRTVLTNISFYRLEYVDLSRNSFSGPVPSTLFERPILVAVSLYDNCFSGTLPSSICSPHYLEVLMLDSVGHGENCETIIPPALRTIVKAHFTNKLARGTIPECVWSMPYLTTLHLAGNGLHGTLGEIPSSSRLVNIALSFNYLQGTIPSSLQLLGPAQLDLSSNRLTGTLMNSFAVPHIDKESESADVTSTKLFLRVNRLSGFTPQTLNHIPNVEVVEGNLFECNANHLLPSTDPSSATYVCGSSNFTYSIAAWCFFVLVIYSLWIAVFRGCYCFEVETRRSRISVDVSDAIEMSQKSDRNLNNIDVSNPIGGPIHDSEFTEQPSFRDTFANDVDMTTQTSTEVNQVGKDWHEMILLFQTFHDVLDEFIAQHREVCASNLTLFLWTLRKGCLTVAVLTAFYASISLMTYLLLKYVQAGVEVSSSTIVSYSTHTHQYLWTSTAAFLHGAIPTVLILLFVIISGQAIRILFGHIGTEEAVQRKLSKEKRARKLEDYPHFRPLDWTTYYIVLIPLGFQLLNVIVTMTVNISYVFSVLSGVNEGLLTVIQLLLGIYKIFWNSLFVPYAISRMPFLHESRLMALTVTMKIFNYIAGPVLATYLTDANCLYYALKGPPAESSSFYELQKDLPKCKTVNFGEKATTICVVLPQFVSLTTTLTPPWLYSYQCSSALLVNYIPVLVFTFTITGILLPVLLYVISTQLRRGKLPVWISSLVRGTIYSTFAQNHLYSEESPLSCSFNCGLNELFNGMAVTSRVVLNIAVISTFGLASPLLAAAIALDVLQTALLWRHLVASYLKDAVDWWKSKATSTMDTGRLDSMETVIDGALEELNRATAGSCAGQALAVKIIVGGMAIFWSLFVFDMVADVYGDISGAYAIVSAFGTMGLFFITDYLHRKFVATNQSD